MSARKEKPLAIEWRVEEWHAPWYRWVFNGNYKNQARAVNVVDALNKDGDGLWRAVRVEIYAVKGKK